MAEAAMFSVASKLLSTIASPAFEKAYEKACSIRRARDELNKLKRSIGTIQAVLLDAEKKQESSAAVKNWIKRVRGVLYDAEDLFDEVTTDDMLRKQIKGNNKLFKKCIQGEEEDDGKQSPKVTAGSNALPLPDLKTLTLCGLPKLKGWWGKVEPTTTDEDVEADQDLEVQSHTTMPTPWFPQDHLYKECEDDTAVVVNT